MIARLLSVSVLLLSTSVFAVPGSPLKHHPSPYLAMHADDPVAWRLWGPEVLEEARREDRLVLLSIGYFACHWCHVMQRESYADAEVGKLINSRFIPVKVDRELRPELDRRMIRFVEAVRGQAGWPLHVFLTPQGYPVTGFTYLPRDQFVRVLKTIDRQWRQHHDEMLQVSREYFEQTEAADADIEPVPDSKQTRQRLLEAFEKQALQAADVMQGGFGGRGKFPNYPQLSALLELLAHAVAGDKALRDFLKLTLDVMASRHLMDHVNDGFFRYTTDPDWETPHFEKMLDDNAQLAMLYFQAEQVFPGQGYRDIGLRTLEFMDHALQMPDGLYASSLSAVDEHHVEGGAYWWTLAELRALLDADQYAHLLKIWNLDPERDERFLASPLIGIGADDSRPQMNRRIRERLRHAPKPAMPVDTKQLASGNALALRAWSMAAAQGDARIHRRASELYRAIRQRFLAGDDVQRFAGARKIAETTLRDYAQMASAMAVYARVFDDPEAERLALKLVSRAFARFYRNDHWFQSDRAVVPGDPGMMVVPDEVQQSPVPLLIEVVLRSKQAPEALKQRARSLFHRISQDMIDLPFYHATAISLGLRLQTAVGGH